MRENLVGYLLGALDADEHAQMKQALEDSDSLRQECDLLQGCLLPLQTEAKECPPPPDLSERTCRYVDGESRRLGVRRPRPRSGLGGRHSGRRILSADLLVMGGIIAALALLFFPAVARSRFQSQVAACQGNLHQLGQALSTYSSLHGGLFPEVPHEGNRAVAGIYAPILFENELVSQARFFVCPGSELAASNAPYVVPALQEVDDAEGGQLRRLQRKMGGSYGYTLGYVENDRVLPVRDQGRNHFAVMADMPSLHLVGRQSANHRQSGQNVLYESGLVRYLVDCQCKCGDPIFLSDRGFVEPGLHENDAVIGESASRPTLLIPVDFRD